MSESATLEFWSSIVENLFTTTPSSGYGLYETTATADTLAMQKQRELNCKTFTFVVYVVLFGTMMLFGLVGNTLSFIVLQFDRHSHAATFLLQVMMMIHYIV